MNLYVPTHLKVGTNAQENMEKIGKSQSGAN